MFRYIISNQSRKQQFNFKINQRQLFLKWDFFLMFMVVAAHASVHGMAEIYIFHALRI